MVIIRRSHMLARGSVCLEKSCAMLMVLQPAGADLLLLLTLGALQWTM